MHTLLARLWELAEKEALHQNTSPEMAFDRIGLILQPFSADYRYTYSPVNTTTFASTGGDGVHFGFLHINGHVTDDSPVVMTVPMAFDKMHLIVGRDLYQFLCLGSEISYFFLEQLLYQEEEAVHWLVDHSAFIQENYLNSSDNSYQEKQRLLALLRSSPIFQH